LKSERPGCSGFENNNIGAMLPSWGAPWKFSRVLRHSIDMFYLIYVSSASQMIDANGLIEILEKARKKNERLGITGMLLYKAGNFMQLLEGEREIVLDLFETIRHDYRHRDVKQIIARETESRCFPNWSMGFSNMESCPDLPDYKSYIHDSLLDRKFQDDAQFAVKFMLTFNELNP
jgi:hypothetical protein